MKYKIPQLKNNFGSEIIKRGYDYYEQGRVKNLIIEGKNAKAIVSGTRNYRVTINLQNSNFKCTCPYESNCKHLVAVIYELRNNSKIATTEDLKSKLNKKSKEELIEILQKINKRQIVKLSYFLVFGS